MRGLQTFALRTQLKTVTISTLGLIPKISGRTFMKQVSTIRRWRENTVPVTIVVAVMGLVCLSTNERDLFVTYPIT